MSRGFGIAGLQLYTSDPSIPGANPISYIMTDHNRSPIQISYERVESSSRMANGTMRRFITANKKKINLSWNMVPAAGGYSFTADGNLGAAWLKSFYEEYVYDVVWIKLTYADEAWRFQNTVSNPDRTRATNQTFNRTAQNTTTTNSFQVDTIQYSAFTNGQSLATVSTVTPHNFVTGTEIMLSGINQLFNGTWIVNAAPSDTTFNLYFADPSTNTPSATFKINSYVQNATSASFNVDDTAFIKNGAEIVISNSNNTLGQSINGTWTVTATPTSKTLFTASWSGTNQTGTGQYGNATIKTSTALSSTSITTLSPIATGPIVSSDIIKVFITNFTYNINKRLTLTDYVDMSIEFTEI